MATCVQNTSLAEFACGNRSSAFTVGGFQGTTAVGDSVVARTQGTAVGASAQATTSASAFGAATFASGDSSVAIGGYNEAAASNSIAIGY